MVDGRYNLPCHAELVSGSIQIYTIKITPTRHPEGTPEGSQ